jgi:hypothetical protein
VRRGLEFSRTHQTPSFAGWRPNFGFGLIFGTRARSLFMVPRHLTYCANCSFLETAPPLFALLNVLRLSKGSKAQRFLSFPPQQPLLHGLCLVKLAQTHETFPVGKWNISSNCGDSVSRDLLIPPCLAMEGPFTTDPSIFSVMLYSYYADSLELSYSTPLETSTCRTEDRNSLVSVVLSLHCLLRRLVSDATFGLCLRSRLATMTG